MFRFSKTLLFGLALGALLSCGGGKLSENLPADRQAEYDWLKQTKPVLDQKRADYKALVDQVDQFAVPVSDAPAEEGAAPAPTLEELTAKRDALKKEISQLTTDFQSKLESFLYELDTELLKVHQKNPNVNPRKEYNEINGFMTEENMLVCKEWVAKQGDYKKAIQTMEDLLESDPENATAKDYLAQLKIEQYMTPERLALVTRGMSEDDVAKTIGMVYRNFKEKWEGREDEPDAMAWYYPREDTGVAAVVFIKDSSGNFIVGKTDYDAKKPKSEEKEEEAAPAE